MINVEPNVGNDKDKFGRVGIKMTVTKMTDHKVRKMIARIQGLGDAMTSDQLRTVIAEETSSESSDSEGEQEVNRVIRDQVWPGTSVTARKRNVRYIAAEGTKNEDESKSGNESKSSDENENSDTEVEQENNQVIWDHVWPGTREKARKRSIKHTTVEGGMNEAKGAGQVRGRGRGA